MGLDQYAVACAWTLEELQSDKETPTEELMRWRKHNRLEGWMANLWREKYERFEDTFNVEYVELTPDDIDRLEAAIHQKELPYTIGFFFGGDSYAEYEEYDKVNDLFFIEKARQAFQCGLKVYYYSWW